MPWWRHNSNEEYKGRIRVDRTATPWEGSYDKVAVSVLAGTSADIWIMHRENVPAHANWHTSVADGPIL